MANYRYSRYQYETSPRKLEPEYEPVRENYQRKKTSTISKKSSKTKQKAQLKSHIKAIIYVLLIFAALFVISYRNSLINESSNHNESLKTQLSAIQKENEQLRVSLENNMNLTNIEKLAEKRLGMQKLDNSQKVYVSLDKKDYVEPASEEVVIQEDGDWVNKMLNTILGK